MPIPVLPAGDICISTPVGSVRHSQVIINGDVSADGSSHLSADSQPKSVGLV